MTHLRNRSLRTLVHLFMTLVVSLLVISCSSTRPSDLPELICTAEMRAVAKEGRVPLPPDAKFKQDLGMATTMNPGMNLSKDVYQTRYPIDEVIQY